MEGLSDEPTPSAASAGRTRAVELRGHARARRRVAPAVAGAVLFAIAFLAAYEIGSDPTHAPATPAPKTWHGAAVKTLPGSTIRIADPIARVAALPSLQMDTPTQASSAAQTQVSVRQPSGTTTGAAPTRTAKPRPATTTRTAPATTTSPKLITVSN